MPVSVSYTDIFGGSPVLPSQESLNRITLTENIALEWPTSFRNTDNVTADILEVNPDANGHTITFPNATFVSIGKVIQVINISPFIFEIDKFDNTGLTPVTAGQTLYIYLRDNTTIGGTWGILPLGAGIIGGIQDFSATVMGIGLAIAGSPVVPVSGALTFELSPSLQFLSTIDTLPVGLLLWNGAAVISRSLAPGLNIAIVNPDGVAGNPIISLENNINLNSIGCVTILCNQLTSDYVITPRITTSLIDAPTNIILAPTTLLLNKQIPIIAGKVQSDGTIVAGFGFTPSQTSPGRYLITFDVPFVDTNYIVDATIRSTPGFIYTFAESAGSIAIGIDDSTGAPQDAGFFFSILKV